MAVNRRSRRRSPRLVLLAVAATVVALLVAGSAHSRSNRTQDTLTYFDEVSPTVQRSTNEGADLADIRNSAVKLGRDGIARRLDRLVAETNATLTAATTVVPPLELRTTHAYLVAALGLRSKAAAEARTAMNQALSVGPPDPAIQGLLTTGTDIALADHAYGLFQSSLPGVGAGGEAPPPMPASSWITAGTDWSAGDIGVFVTTLRSSTSLTPVHDLAVVTFATDPAPVANDGSAFVLPPARRLQVSIVVANVGNEPEKNATVTAVLYTSGANTSEQVRDFVDMVPGQRVAIKIGSLHPVSGTTGTLTVSITPAIGETNLANNSEQIPVEIR